MKILLTGGAGFISSHTAEYLAGRGHTVHILDRFSYAGRFRNVASLSDARVWVGDLKEQDVCDRMASFKFDAIVHAASNTHVDRAIDAPIDFTMDNVLGTNRLLWAVTRLSPSTRIIAYSTDEVYGPTPAGERFDESAAFNPSNAYSASKVGIEGLARSYYTTHGLDIMVVRPCNTYGRRQHPEKVIPKFVRQAMEGKALTVHGDGSGARDWLHTSDHAAAIECVLSTGTAGEAYNLAAGDEHTDQEVAETILRLTGSTAGIRYIAQRPGHDKRYWMDGSKVRSLGWRPVVPFGSGFEDAVRWNMEHQGWWDDDSVPVRELVAANG